MYMYSCTYANAGRNVVRRASTFKSTGTTNASTACTCIIYIKYVFERIVPMCSELPEGGVEKVLRRPTCFIVPLESKQYQPAMPQKESLRPASMIRQHLSLQAEVAALYLTYCFLSHQALYSVPTCGSVVAGGLVAVMINKYDLLPTRNFHPRVTAIGSITRRNVPQS